MKNFKIPARFIKQTAMHTPRPKYIILHNGICLTEYPDPKIQIDNKKYQFDEIKFLHVNQLKLSDLNYHYVLDRINGDYEILIGKPFHSACIFDDIDDLYFHSIHIAIMGDYSLDIADKRLYEVLAYKLIVPLMYWFYLDESHIKFHNEVSNNKECDCPGSFLFKEILINNVTKFKSGR